MKPLVALFIRDWRLSLRVGGGALMGALFFLIVVTIVPFGVGPDLRLLARIGSAILWIGALLATLLTLDRLYQGDRDDGVLDLLVMGDTPLELVVLVKCLAHWAATGLPLVIMAPLLAVFMNMEPAAVGSTVLTLLIGTPALTFLGSIGAALTVSLRRGGVLSAILVLPLTIPLLIFGVSATSAVDLDSGPATFTTPFLILSALALFSVVVGSVASAQALRLAAE
jgi:heme exporter protein B